MCRTLAPHPPTSDNISFLPYPSNHPQSGRHMCITPNQATLSNNTTYFKLMPSCRLALVGLGCLFYFLSFPRADFEFGRLKNAGHLFEFLRCQKLEAISLLWGKLLNIHFNRS